MTIYEDTNSKPLLDLLDRIHSGDMVLPDFQRDFVWVPSATQVLIVSIAKNYPVGSILRVRDCQRAFSSREFEGAPPATTEHTFLLLYCQQRLTYLYQAFYGVGDSHLIPHGPKSWLWDDEYERFLSERLQIFSDAVAAATSPP